jgi:hypothetical protein
VEDKSGVKWNQLAGAVGSVRVKAIDVAIQLFAAAEAASRPSDQKIEALVADAGANSNNAEDPFVAAHRVVASIPDGQSLATLVEAFASTAAPTADNALWLILQQLTNTSPNSEGFTVLPPPAWKTTGFSAVSAASGPIFASLQHLRVLHAVLDVLQRGIVKGFSSRAQLQLDQVVIPATANLVKALYAAWNISVVGGATTDATQQQVPSQPEVANSSSSAVAASSDASASAKSPAVHARKPDVHVSTGEAAASGLSEEAAAEEQEEEEEHDEGDDVHTDLADITSAIASGRAGKPKRSMGSTPGGLANSTPAVGANPAAEAEAAARAALAAAASDLRIAALRAVVESALRLAGHVDMDSRAAAMGNEVTATITSAASATLYRSAVRQRGAPVFGALGIQVLRRVCGLDSPALTAAATSSPNAGTGEVADNNNVTVQISPRPNDAVEPKSSTPSSTSSRGGQPTQPMSPARQQSFSPRLQGGRQSTSTAAGATRMVNRSRIQALVSAGIFKRVALALGLHATSEVYATEAIRLLRDVAEGMGPLSGELLASLGIDEAAMKSLQTAVKRLGEDGDVAFIANEGGRLLGALSEVYVSMSGRGFLDALARAVKAVEACPYVRRGASGSHYWIVRPSGAANNPGASPATGDRISEMPAEYKTMSAALEDLDAICEGLEADAVPAIPQELISGAATAMANNGVEPRVAGSLLHALSRAGDYHANVAALGNPSIVETVVSLVKYHLESASICDHISAFFRPLSVHAEHVQTLKAKNVVVALCDIAEKHRNTLLAVRRRGSPDAAATSANDVGGGAVKNEDVDASILNALKSPPASGTPSAGGSAASPASSAGAPTPVATGPVEPRISHYCIQCLANIACDKVPDDPATIPGYKAFEEHLGRDCPGGVARVVAAGGVDVLKEAMSAHLDRPRLLEDALCAMSNIAFPSEGVRLLVGRTSAGNMIPC